MSAAAVSSRSDAAVQQPSAAVDAANAYVCPGCGQRVEMRQREIVQLHHRHVIDAAAGLVRFEKAVRAGRALREAASGRRKREAKP